MFTCLAHFASRYVRVFGYFEAGTTMTQLLLQDYSNAGITERAVHPLYCTVLVLTTASNDAKQNKINQ